MKELTVKQERVFLGIKEFIDEHSYSPTNSEIQKRMGFLSVNSVTGYLDAIEKKGYIKRTPKIARSIVVLQT